jgi:hypothetical protein
MTTLGPLAVSGVRPKVLAAFDRYVLARRTGDLTGAVGAAQFRLREARNDSALTAEEVWVDGTNAAVRACTAHGDGRVVVLRDDPSFGWSVVQLLAPSEARWCQ